MKTVLKITKTALITHDVLRIRTEKPLNLDFHAGQAADISINQEAWHSKKRAFTFTSLPEDDFLEFTIKTYPTHHGVTEMLLNLNPGDELLLHGIFGSISYQGEGIFIAGGAGITPFIAIFHDLEKKGKLGRNKLIFANKTKSDIIEKEYFTSILGTNFINVLSEEQSSEYVHGFVNSALLEKQADKKTPYYYVCGPGPMIEAVVNSLNSLGVQDEYIILEKF